MTAGVGQATFPRYRIAGYATLYPGGWVELVPPDVALDGDYRGETHIPRVRRLLLGLWRDAYSVLLRRVGGVYVGGV